ncbi:OsmC family protein [Photobacterium rosenbergii]|uniref:OsmC family protein n=1 Tax=Photobacterium rosenbergii TaxID=294936 RepID=A0ABU3ZBP8_9GAMM|nr:OsmC family protein [Photobacterium rosenbergii]MDV5167393.1 OsmC family protein [Photobacterium rosenbergii]
MDKLTFEAKVDWTKGKEEQFVDNNFSRAHLWHFDGGLSVPASSSHHIIPIPLSNPDNIDPEQAFIAAVSSCHMMALLTIASKRKYVVESYSDKAIGILERDNSGRSSITKVTLRPVIRFSGANVPSKDNLRKLHKVAHDNCFIANSVKAEITVDIL